MDDLLSRVEATRVLLQEVRDLLPGSEASDLEREFLGISRRLGYLGREVVVALVGGTGSGKSSLLNAMAGTEIAETGVIRPTTNEPLAWIPRQAEPGLTRLLDDLGIVQVVPHDLDPWLVVLDLPDVDSVESGHRARVEELLPRIDVVAWVVDPEKYSDRVLLEDFISPLARYQDQFVFVLNQVDRVPPADRTAIVDHLSARLRDVGIEASVLAVAAAPFRGSPMGMAALGEHLIQRFREKDIVRRKLAIDLESLLSGIGLAVGGSAPVAAGWREAGQTLAPGALRLVAPPTLDAAFEQSGRLTISRHTSGPIGVVLGMFRRGGRAFGVSQAGTRVEEITSRWREREGRAALEGSATSVFMAAAQDVGSTFGAPLRARARSVPDDVESAIETARRVTANLTEVPVRSWWRLLAILAWVATLAVGAAVAWGWSIPTAIGDGFDPVALGSAGVGLGLIVRWIVRAIGTRSGRKAASGYRTALEEALEAAFARRLGEPYDSHTQRARSTWRTLRQLSAGDTPTPSPSVVP